MKKEILESVDRYVRKCFKEGRKGKALLIAPHWYITDYTKTVGKAWIDHLGEDADPKRSYVGHWADCYQQGYLFDFMGLPDDVPFLESEDEAEVPVGPLNKLWIVPK